MIDGSSGNGGRKVADKKGGAAAAANSRGQAGGSMKFAGGKG